MNIKTVSAPLEYLKLFESLPDLYLILDVDLVILNASDAFLKATHTHREQITGKEIFTVFPGDGESSPYSNCEKYLRDSLNYVIRHKVSHTVDTILYDEQKPFTRFEQKFRKIISSPVLNEDGDILYIINKVQQVAEQENVKPDTSAKEITDTPHVLPFNPEKPIYDLFMEVEVALVVFGGPNFLIEFANSAFFQISDRKATDVLGKPLFEVFPEITGQGFEELLGNVLNTGTPFIGKELPATVYRKGKLDTLYFDFVYQPVRGWDGKITGVSIIAKEVTDMILLRNQQQKEIINTILCTQENERGRIAEALHNGLGQLLYAAKLHVEGNLKIKNDPLNTLLDEAIVQTRTVAFELMPGVLEDFGLDTALEELCKRLTKVNFKVECHIYGYSERLECILETAIFRITQELVNNIIKHSHASQASIILNISNETILLTVEDNGVGFQDMPEKTGGRKGTGLATIRNRVKLLEGTMTIEPNLPTGSIIRISITRRKETIETHEDILKVEFGKSTTNSYHRN